MCVKSKFNIWNYNHIYTVFYLHVVAERNIQALFCESKTIEKRVRNCDGTTEKEIKNTQFSHAHAQVSHNGSGLFFSSSRNYLWTDIEKKIRCICAKDRQFENGWNH